jgi:mRNA interferase MazF
LETDSIVVCPLTTDQVATQFLRPPLDPEPANGLEAKSRVMVDKVGAIPRARMGKRLGEITADQMRSIEDALGTFLGFAR